METAKRNELKKAYRGRTPVGGIYCIRCQGNQRQWIKSTKDLASQQNKFAFALSIQSCPEPCMRAEWAQYGGQTFTFTVLDPLSRKEDQTEQEFGEDIALLLALWTEKLGQTAESSDKGA